MNSEKISDSPNGGLKRVLGLGALCVYGLGDILGAGIYAVIGEIAGAAGELAWVSFAVALAVVFLTALSYAEMGSRVPKSGGASLYVHEAFNKKWFSFLTGWMLLCATVMSMATLSRAFVGYLENFGLQLPDPALILAFLALLLLINLRGIKHSSWANLVSTAVELSGLLMILGFGAYFLSGSTETAVSAPLSPESNLSGILRGAALAFFAFTGFEDLANIAEEAKKPERHIPRAILTALIGAGVIYIAVSWTSTAILPARELAPSSAPLLKVIQTAYPPMPMTIFSLIALFAVANTSLLNYITASRLLYGMSQEQLVPKFFSRVHKRYNTPYAAILIILPVVFGLALTGTLGKLASSTSALVLIVFSLVNISLIKIHRRSTLANGSKEVFKIPKIVPWLAVTLNFVALLYLPRTSLIPVAGIIALGLIFSFVVARK